MTILGIETSCDESALALIETRVEDGTVEYRIISSLIHSQADLHSPYGGVFPSLAKREHGHNLPLLMDKLIKDWRLDTEAKPQIESNKLNQIIADFFDGETVRKNPDLFESIKKAHFPHLNVQIDRIAVTEGPGLEPALWVGITFAELLSKIWSIPVIPINHMEGHIIGSFLKSDKPSDTWQKMRSPEIPSIALLISGGHTELVKVTDKSSDKDVFSPSYEILGQTKDDAVGEAFDKVARLLGLPYPGGPQISILSNKARKEGIKPAIKLPRPMIKSNDLNFSFSGLKTAVLYAIRDNTSSDGILSENFKKELALEFEEAVADVLDNKLRQAIDKSGAKSIVIGGGVSANAYLRQRFAKIASDYNIPLYLPTSHVSGDNALMIALASIYHFEDKNTEKIRAKGTKRLGI